MSIKCLNNILDMFMIYHHVSFLKSDSNDSLAIVIRWKAV